MIVISDTPPLISLMKIGLLGLLRDLFGEIVIPKAVYSELTVNHSFPEEVEAIKNCEFIKVREVQNSMSVELLRRATNLDAGESESIILSDTEKDSILLIDEAHGRKVAKAMNLKIMGTIGVLVFAYDEKLITKDQIEKAIDDIRKSELRISDSLLEILKKKISG